MEFDCTPYWRTGLVKNESVLFTEENGEICGYLQFTPSAVISVKDYTLQNSFSPGVDFIVRGNKLVRLNGSRLPFLTAENLNGKGIAGLRLVSSVGEAKNAQTDYVRWNDKVIYTESPLYYGNQVLVSYTYRSKAQPQPKNIVRLSANMRVALIGDSVAEGCSCSKRFSHPPYQPDWFELFCTRLKETAGDIVFRNFAKGGMTSRWGAEEKQLARIKDFAPTLLLVHFGINDCGERLSATEFSDNLLKIIDNVAARSVLISPFCPNLFAYDKTELEEKHNIMKTIAEKRSDVLLADMYSLSKEMLKTKKYVDVTGNGINHPNDFIHRVYAMKLREVFLGE